jgi:hypothetical protein
MLSVVPSFVAPEYWRGPVFGPKSSSEFDTPGIIQHGNLNGSAPTALGPQCTSPETAIGRVVGETGEPPGSSTIANEEAGQAAVGL